MRLSIHHQHHVAVPPDLPAFLAKHVTRPLARVYDSPAAELGIHLGDERPAKGGVNQECRLSFRMPGARTIHVESVQDDLKKALLDAADRLRRHVRKQLSKMRSGVRKPMHRPLGRSWRERSTRRGSTPDGGPAGL
jgi:ribosome-associated translation inhibitor RaiA